MAVYVDPIMQHGGSASFRWTRSCHLYADTLDELHAFAGRIGLKRAWFQSGRFPHYDLNEGRHRAAIASKAIQHDRRQAVDMWRRMGWTRQHEKDGE